MNGEDRGTFERLARAEERIEFVNKKIEDLEEKWYDRLDEKIANLERAIAALDRAAKERVDALEARLTSTINGRIEKLDNKYILTKAVVMTACTMVLTAFFAAVVATFVGAPLRLPTLPQPATVQPKGGFDR